MITCGLDLVSSVLVGSLWALSPAGGWGFALAGTLQLLGAAYIARAEEAVHGSG